MQADDPRYADGDAPHSSTTSEKQRDLDHEAKGNANCDQAPANLPVVVGGLDLYASQVGISQDKVHRLLFVASTDSG